LVANDRVGEDALKPKGVRSGFHHPLRGGGGGRFVFGIDVPKGGGVLGIRHDVRETIMHCYGHIPDGVRPRAGVCRRKKGVRQRGVIRAPMMLVVPQTARKGVESGMILNAAPVDTQYRPLVPRGSTMQARVGAAAIFVDERDAHHRANHEREQERFAFSPWQR
jgi:hypothetical protein